MSRSRYSIVVALVALTGISVWATVSTRGTHEAPALAEDSSPVSADRATSQTGTAWKMVVPDDPRAREALAERCRQEWAARNARQAAEARARAGQWQGCRFVPSALRDNAEEYARQKEAADLLSAQTAPQGRVDFFRSYLSQEDFHHVGWEGGVMKVVDTPDGKAIELHVRPSLTSAGGGYAHTSRTYRETWHIDVSGRLSLERGEDGGGLGLIMVD
jgi:hypothetical protein